MKNKKKLYSRSAIGYSVIIAFIAVIIIDLLLFFWVLHAPYGLMPPGTAPFVVGAVATLLLLIVIFIAVYLVLNPLIKALNKLIKSMQEVADGNLSTRLETNSTNLLNKAFENFNKMVADLNGLELLKEDFISKFSHEFKTPIASINGFAQLLTDPNIPVNKKEEYSKIIAEESERLSKLSGQIMLLTNLENKTIISEKENVEIDEELRKAVISLLPSLEAKELSYELDVQKATFYSNAELLREIWINLLNNSIKFTPKGGTIFISCKEKRGGKVSVIIGNNGPIIAEKEKNKIFQKFYQGNYDQKNQGLGLGLSIVKQILDLVGGKITVKTSYKNTSGTFFEVIL
ncbi:HAMP domain-containing histidine kinase [Lactobacillus sp. PV037]|uniref:sensor histidine kinase n=1 Tax=Lactobacillus sp. PV037 TaxID=2594496 RepID=UPI00223FBE6F|nr:HAMP domain-containing sensor histidine kinase [Lactobacillus sp. PV037]QNQ84342.1 HAMP domain-containing histidine kinase [Lactobacillus sp. PV037]